MTLTADRFDLWIASRSCTPGEPYRAAAVAAGFCSSRRGQIPGRGLGHVSKPDQSANEPAAEPGLSRRPEHQSTFTLVLAFSGDE